MWPPRLEMNRDECRKCLRCLELDAYGNMVSVLRAQGPFTNEKQKLLQELAKVLHISNERHRAEIRRAVNDEKLATIAEQLNGPNTGIDWTIEGRRAIPLLPRLKARSAFTTLANSLSFATAVANEKKPDRHVVSGWSRKPTVAVETESQLKMKVEEDISTDMKICTFENELDNTKNFQESSNICENERINNKGAVEEVAEKTLKISEKRKSPSRSPVAPANKVLVVSPGSLETLNHAVINKGSESNSQVLQATMHHQNIKLIPLTVGEISGNPSLKENTVIAENTSRHALTSSSEYIDTAIPICTDNSSKPKSIVTSVQNKVTTKVASIALNETSTVSLIQSENKDARLQDDTNNEQKSSKSENSSNLSCIKRVAPVTHTNTKSIVSTPLISYTSKIHRVMAMQPGTAISSGPGPPQIKQTSSILTYKKWPSEQTTTFNPQSTAKMSVTINSKKAINIPHPSNTKLTAKTNVIVIQKGHAKGVTLSHAGKEVLGKVIMGGKNLCVTSQHNANSASILPHHITLNGEQTTTLPTINTSNTESAKTNIKSGNTIVFNLRQDILEKNKILSHCFDSPSVLNSEPKTVIQSKYTCFPKGECNSDTNTVIGRGSSWETDSVITSTTEEKQHRKNVNTSMNSQVINSLNSSKALGIKDILIRPRQLANVQDAESDIQQDSNEDTNALEAKFDSTNLDAKNLQYLETVIINHVDEHNDS